MLSFPRKTILVSSITVIFLLGNASHAGSDLLVTSSADNGDGSLRWALEAANLSAEANRIVVAVDDDITISSTLTYEGRAPLEIIGLGQSIKTTQNTTLLAVTQGASLHISDLSFEGPGGFDIENRGDLDGQVAGKGIFVDVRDDQTETVNFTLSDVIVKGVAAHGVHISDCTLADGCGGGGGGAGGGSPASINVLLNNVEVNDAGNGRFDADGFRVDERGAGSIYFVAQSSVFIGVGADGVELDEGQDGKVQVTIIDTDFIGNGAYCNPALLSGNLPDVAEAEFVDGVMAADSIPAPIVGSLDDGCFEREVELYDSGSVAAYEFGVDLDDGIDLDEAGDGSIEALMIGALITSNFDEGVDFDEEGNGDIVVQFINTNASNNTDDGFKMSELDAGGIDAQLMQATAVENGGKGAVFEEENDGSVNVSVAYTSTAGNDDGDQTGIEVVQEDSGGGTLSILASTIEDGMSVEGLD
jgi:hypothetical protein